MRGRAGGWVGGWVGGRVGGGQFWYLGSTPSILGQFRDPILKAFWALRLLNLNVFSGLFPGSFICTEFAFMDSGFDVCRFLEALRTVCSIFVALETRLKIDGVLLV